MFKKALLLIIALGCLAFLPGVGTLKFRPPPGKASFPPEVLGAQFPEKPSLPSDLAALTPRSLGSDGFSGNCASFPSGEGRFSGGQTEFLRGSHPWKKGQTSRAL